MVIIKITALALISILSPLAIANQTPKCPTTPYVLSTPADYDHLRYAPAETERLFDGGSFVASVDSYDDDNGDGTPEYLVQPSWVAVHIKSYQSSRGSNYAPGFKRPRDWYRIKLFDEERKQYSTNKRIDDSYDGVGRTWNRGHLAQRADANRMGEAFGCNTHVFANAVPQKSEFNQGIWLGLENYISSLANERGELWVVTGPIYEQDSELITIGETEKNEIPVAIPDKLFKVVFIESDRGVEVISFIYANKYDVAPSHYLTGNCQRDKQYNHTPFIVSLDDVEQATGLTFFSDLDMDLEEFKKARATQLPSISKSSVVGYCL
jgi:DNA/RNA endonuclease G (NUC1)